MTRIKGILAAGTMTGLVLITIIVLGIRSARADQVDQTPTPNIVLQPVVLPDGSAGTQLAVPTQGDAQAQIDQLQAAVRLMQERESQYRTQIEAANQTILQLQGQLSAQVSQSYQHDEEHEHEEHEEYDDD